MILLSSADSSNASLFCASASNQIASFIDARHSINSATAASFSFVNSATGAVLVAPTAPFAALGSPVPISATLSLADYLRGGGILEATTVFQCEATPIAPFLPTAIVGCSLTNRYAASSSICGAARHASAFSAVFAPLLVVNVSQVSLPVATAYCQLLQNQVQTSAGVASAIEPAFYFPSLEQSAASLAAVVSAVWNTSAPLNATCQQTFSSLFRGLVPPRNTRVTISCPQCMMTLRFFMLTSASQLVCCTIF